MTDYWVKPKIRIFIKVFQFLCFAKNMGKNVSQNFGKNINKNVSGKCSQKRLDHAKQSATDAIKTRNYWSSISIL